MLLFKELCNIRSESFDSSLIDYASPTVLGQLFYNRMQAASYLCLRKHGLLSKVNREFRNALKGAYEQNKVKNESFYQCIKYLNKSLSGCKCKYAMLKGALLCKIYPEGCRTSNDIDLLVMPEDVTEIGIFRDSSAIPTHLKTLNSTASAATMSMLRETQISFTLFTGLQNQSITSIRISGRHMLLPSFFLRICTFGAMEI